MRQLKGLGFRQRIAGTALCLLVYFIMLSIPVPFANRAAAADYISGSGLFVFERLTGGDLSNMSLAALGIAPYISASIFLQLGGVVIPAIHDMQRNGSSGERKLKRITFVLSMFISLFSGFGFAVAYANNGFLVSTSRFAIFVAGTSFAVGVAILCGFAMLITEYFFGNGMSVFLLVSILRSFIRDFVSYYNTLQLRLSGSALVSAFVFTIAIGIMFLAVIVYLNGKDKLIPVMNPLKVSSSDWVDQKYTSIPIRMISGGVMPAIFASSMFVFPRMASSFFRVDWKWFELFDSSMWFYNGVPTWRLSGVAVYFVLILWAEFYCQSLSASSSEMADSLKQRSAVVNGLAPGKTTEVFLRSEFNKASLRSTWIIAGIVLIPMLISSWLNLQRLSFFGTSAIIIVVVFHDLIKEFNIGIRFEALRSNDTLFIADDCGVPTVQ